MHLRVIKEEFFFSVFRFSGQLKFCAQFSLRMKKFYNLKARYAKLLLYGPPSRKTGLQGLRQGLTQTYRD